MSKHDFFEKAKEHDLALSYRDVILRTGHSEVLPSEVSTKSMFSRNVPLHTPIVSAAMDTVTESKMAIAMAILGGIGVIHRNLTPKTHAKEVARVKFFLNGLIAKPFTVLETETMEEILNRRDEKKWPFHSLPVVNSKGKIRGLLTKNDFDFCDDLSRLARDVVTTELITAPLGTSLDEAYNLMREARKKVLLLVNEEGKLAGMYTFSDLKRIKSKKSALYNVDDRGQLRVAAAVGVGDAALERAELLVEQGVDAIVIDTAHGDSREVIRTLRELKKLFPATDVVAGNISEPESAKRLADAGADGVKVGQGPGSICTTRIIAGIGCPQLTAVYNCAYAIAFSIEGSGVPVCADGGIEYSGDITKAIAAGAHSVMIGSLLAGTEETPGDTVLYQGMKWKDYRGMGSLGAMESSNESKERYRQAGEAKGKLVPEGVEGLVPYRGGVSEVIEMLVGGLRSGMGYVGAAIIEELREKVDFHRLTDAGVRESHPHGILITKDAPNYKGMA